MFLITDLSKPRTSGPSWYSTECKCRIVGYLRLTRYLTVEIRPRCPSDIDWNGVNMSVNCSLYFKYSSWMTIDLRQSDLPSTWEDVGHNSSSVLTIPMMLGPDCSSWDVFHGYSALATVYISSFRCQNILSFSKRCCFVVLLVIRIKNRRLEKAWTTLFAGNYSWVTVLGSG